MQPLTLRLSFALLATALGAFAQNADPNAVSALVTKLLTSPTQDQRIALLNDTDFVFNFNAGVGVTKGAGGTITTANVADFPAVVGNGMAMAVGHMGEPCGLNTPHTHPRATEFLFVISGTALEVGFIEENGARYVNNTVFPGQAALFPKGSIHFQANLGCEPLQFVAALNNIDPGVISVAQRFFGLPPNAVAAALGDVGVQNVVSMSQNIPDNVALGVQQCLDKCGLSRGSQNTTQLQPRVSGNALPSGSTSSSSSSSVPSATARKRSPSEDISSFQSPGSTSQTDSASYYDMIPMMRIAVGVMLMGYVVIGGHYFLSHRRRGGAVELHDNDHATREFVKV